MNLLIITGSALYAAYLQELGIDAIAVAAPPKSETTGAEAVPGTSTPNDSAVNDSAPLPPLHADLIFPRDAHKLRALKDHLRNVLHFIGDDPDNTTYHPNLDELRRHAIAHGRDQFEVLDSILHWGRLLKDPAQTIQAVRLSIEASAVAERGIHSASSPHRYTTASALDEIRRILALPPETNTPAARFRLISQVINSTVTGKPM